MFLPSSKTVRYTSRDAGRRRVQEGWRLKSCAGRQGLEEEPSLSLLEYSLWTRRIFISFSQQPNEPGAVLPILQMELRPEGK